MECYILNSLNQEKQTVVDSQFSLSPNIKYTNSGNTIHHLLLVMFSSVSETIATQLSKNYIRRNNPEQVKHP